MTYSLINISGKLSTNLDDPDEVPVISKQDFAKFTSLCPQLWGSIPKLVSVKCASCGSFQIPARELFYLLQEAGRKEISRLQDDDEWLADEIFRHILRNITEVVEATDEEWYSYMVKGSPDLEVLHDKNGDSNWPDSEYPLRLSCDGLVFKMKASCRSCLFWR